MKIDKLSDIQGFFDVVDSCKGTVELITKDGDRLNLKSKLCQILSMTSVFPQISEIPDIEVVAYEQEDVEKLVRFLFK